MLRKIRLASNEAGHNVAQAECEWLLELIVGTREWVAVRAPPAELGRVAEASTLHVVVADLDHPLRAQRHERKVLAGIPAGEFVFAWRALTRLVRGPIPRMIVEIRNERLQLGEQPPSFGHREGADHAH